MASQVFIWIDRADGGREANVGNYQRFIKGTNKEPDEKYAAKVLKAVEGYNGENCADVLADLVKRKRKDDPTGVLADLLAYITKIGATVIERQRRAASGTLRAKELAEIELSNLRVFVRAD